MYKNTRYINLFLSHVVVGEKPDDCWTWNGSKRNKGYGAFCWQEDSGKVIQGRAHRFAFLVFVGDIPDGAFVLHKCDTPQCSNPAHLFIGTNQDNVDDMMKKGRHVAGGTYIKSGLREGKYERGEKHHASKISDAQVEQIKTDRINGMSYGNLCKKYGIKSTGHVWRICTGRSRAQPHCIGADKKQGDLF